MSESGGGVSSPLPGGAPNGAGGTGAGTSQVQHPRSFKLRFAAQREPGRSYVSLVKPRGLPATVTGKFYTREMDGTGAEPEAEPEPERRIRDAFERGPRERLHAPLTESHEYGWWSGRSDPEEARARGDPRRSHHIRDSAWLKARLLVLAADDKLKRK